MLQVHQRLGEFEIIRLLGKGGMGEVYEARQQRPRRSVALKVLAPWLAQDEDALRRFWREAEVPAQLDHPNIVRIITSGQTEGVAYYTMQLVNGLSLAALIRYAQEACPGTVSTAGQGATPSLGAPEPPVDESQAPTILHHPPIFAAYREDRYRTLARIGVMVARALAHAHSRGCIHRDLKPANIMIDEHNHGYVLDFGLTRALESDGMSSLGSISGTPWYMSPEQARGDTVDWRSDLYSFGVTLYELATRGVGPYDANRSQRETVLARVRAGDCLPLREHAPDIPAALEEIILRAMAHRTEDRYQDAGRLADDLERFLAEPASRPAPPPTRRWKPALAALIALAALAAGSWIGLAAWFHPARSEQPAGGNEKAADEKPVVPDDYPKQLLERPWRVPQSLLTLDFKPVWHRRLGGRGSFRHTTHQLMMSARSDEDVPTMLVLDDDPARRWFEFSLDLHCVLGEDGKQRYGVFFGWRKELAHFLAVEIDEHPLVALPHGRARIAVVEINQGEGAPPAAVFHWLGGENGEVPLTQSKTFHRLMVRAIDDRVTVMVDHKQPATFTMDWLVKQRPNLAGAVKLRGALGVWVFKGHFACFRNATATALPSAEK